jgi:protein-S-isoprenylcysteine O-methyltransferase Ste14
MNKHGKKLIAPIIITVLIVLYYIGFVAVAVSTDILPLGWLIAGAVIPLCFAGVMIYVLVERIKEIRSGEEDDLSQY